jgi:hypothetical protein
MATFQPGLVGMGSGWLMRGRRIQRPSALTMITSISAVTSERTIGCFDQSGLVSQELAKISTVYSENPLRRQKTI